jgi:hypothetical protein
MVEGSKTIRTTVASMSTANASATPSCLKMISCRPAKSENVAIITVAALVTTPAVAVMPSITGTDQGGGRSFGRSGQRQGPDGPRERRPPSSESERGFLAPRLISGVEGCGLGQAPHPFVQCCDTRSRDFGL